MEISFCFLSKIDFMRIVRHFIYYYWYFVYVVIRRDYRFTSILGIGLVFYDVDHSVFYFYAVIRKDLIMPGMPNPYTRKYDLFDITKFDLYVIVYVKDQFLYSFIAREWKSFESTFVGKYISFIHLFIERDTKETFTCGLKKGHIAFMSRDTYFIALLFLRICSPRQPRFLV